MASGGSGVRPPPILFYSIVCIVLFVEHGAPSTLPSKLKLGPCTVASKRPLLRCYDGLENLSMYLESQSPRSDPIIGRFV